jgi:Tol biopolymer transport system component
MGDKINSSGYDTCPMLSPDGKYLFFTRNINRNGDIYWVDAKVIETFKSHPR